MRAVDIYVRCVADAILDAVEGNTVGGVASADAEFVEVAVVVDKDPEEAAKQ